jgi:TonB family protein
MLARIIIVGALTLGMYACAFSAFAQTASKTRNGCGKQTKPARRPCAIDYFPGGLYPDDKLLAKPKPNFPEAAKAKGISGNVFVFVLTDTEGNVTSAAIHSGPPLLQQAALDAAKQARFPVTKLSGLPVKIRVLLRYDFDLERGTH